MKTKCTECGKDVDRSELNYLGECYECQRRRDDDDESLRHLTHMAMGDMLNTGIPGGIDMDFTTPL